MLKSDRAFVLILYPYKERNAVVVLFTEHEGLKRAAVKGVKGRRSRFGSALSALSEVKIHFFEHEKGELANLAEADIIKSAIPLILKISCPPVLDHLAEVVMEFVQENEANPRVYRLLQSSLAALETGAPWQQVKTYFDFWIMKLNGTLPDFTKCKCGGEAAYWDREVLKGRCAAHTARGLAFPEGFGALMREMRTRKVDALAAFEAQRESYRFLHAVLKDLMTHFLSRELKSSAMLRECDKLFSV
jgi:DNA repair protein RecO